MTMNESGLKLRIELMKLKYLLTISLAVLLSACTHQNNDVPIQSNGDRYYQNPPITNTDAIAVGAVGASTGYALGKYANKTKTTYGKPVVVVNKYYQTKPKVRVSRYKRK